MIYVSDCCGAGEQMTPDGEPVYDRDTGICPKCHEHTMFGPEIDS